MRTGKLAFFYILITAFSAAILPLQAQDIGATMRIVPIPDGAFYGVDGVFYNHATTWVWSKGSKHMLTVELDAQGDGRTIYRFSQWEYSGGRIPGGNVINITADPAISEIRAVFTVDYALTVAFFSCPNPLPAYCNSPGTVYLNEEKITSDRVIFQHAGANVRLTALPNAGYVFAGWEPGQNQVITGFINNVTMNSPTVVNPRFIYARRVNLLTDPPGLMVLADRSPVVSPAPMDWGIHTTHTLGALTPQQDRTGVWWAFHSWSDGGAATHAYAIDQSTQPVSVTVKYVPVAVTQVSTLPPGLSIKVDGRDNWGSYNFPWGIGETHRIEAPAQLTDEQGRIWQFRSWSNGAAASHTFTVPDAAAGVGVRLIATYDPVARLIVKSSMAGVRVTIDDTECTTPCDIQRPVGSTVRVTAPASIPLADDVRADFSGWPGSGTTAVEWSATLGGDPVSITAGYHIMNRLSASADPPGGVTWRLQPASPDGYYNSQTAVSVNVTPLAGYRFRGWTGDLSGNVPAGVVSMNTPRSVQAMLDRVPYIGPAGVSNAAGPTPQRVVAPGSVVSVFGVNLTGSLVIGPENPLAQTLGGIVVRAADRLLPLFFVSPSQINLQLPPDLGEGSQILTVTAQGVPDMKVGITVVRAAPGIFSRISNEDLMAVATHEDGSPVTVDSPARKGELLTVYGTGFGPTDRPRPVGFAVPVEPVLALAESVSVQVGETTFAAAAAFAAAGRVGVDIVQFRLGDGIPDGGPAPLRLSINGQESNVVLLPIQ